MAAAVHRRRPGPPLPATTPRSRISARWVTSTELGPDAELLPRGPPATRMSATVLLLVLYAAGLVAAGAVVSRRVKGSADFFVAGRALPPRLVFVNLLAANIGAGSTVGATGLAYRYGASAWWWSGSAAIGCVVLGLVVAPRMHRLAATHGFFTVGDFLEWRYDRSVRGLVSLILCLGTLSILAGQL